MTQAMMATLKSLKESLEEAMRELATEYREM